MNPNLLRNRYETVMYTSRMHTYMKKDIYNLYGKAILSKPKVEMLRLTEDDINYYKTNSNIDNFEKYLAKKYKSFQLPQKKFKQIVNGSKQENLNLTQKSKYGQFKQIKNGIKLENLNLTQESKYGQFKSINMFDIDPPRKKFKRTENKERPEMLNLTGESKSGQFMSTFVENTDPSTSTSTSAYKSQLSVAFVPAASSLLPPTTNINETISSIVEKSDNIPAEFMLPFPTINIPENVSSAIPVENMLPSPTTNIPANKKSKEITMCHKFFNNKVWAKHPKTMMDDHNYRRFMSLFLNITPMNTKVNGSISSNTPTKELTLAIENLSLDLIEHLYSKYFSKKVQDTVVVIANILNIIPLSIKHLKQRLNEASKKNTEALKLKERCDANRMHTKQMSILESQLISNFIDVLSLFVDSEFELGLQMFFLGILTVLKEIDELKFRKKSIFKNLTVLLLNSFKNRNFEHNKIFTMFKSEKFRIDCIDVISLIEEGGETDPGIKNRMALFFESPVNSLKFYQKAIAAVTSNLSENFEKLVNDASFQWRQNSQFKDPVKCTVRKMNINNTTESIQNIARIDERVQLVTPTQSQNAIIQTENENEVQITARNTSVKFHPASKSSQPLNTFFSSISTRVPAETMNSVAFKSKFSAVFTPSASNDSFGQTLRVLTPSDVQRIMTTPNKRFDSSPDTTFIGNQQFRIVKAASLNQVRTMNTQECNFGIRAQPRYVESCCVKDCENPASIMCSNCCFMKYCSAKCQTKDWYGGHIKDCDHIKKIRQNRQ